MFFFFNLQMNDFIFNTCSKINDLLTDSKEKEAREELIKLLDNHETNQIEYTPIVNHLIRETGLYPYIHTDTANWEDKFVCEAFKVDTGEKEEKTLHREQSLLLKKLIEGKNIAVSAPTSFGKSFVIDAFISLKNPSNVVIIVPTIALTDETRRRLYKKFASKYKIITTPEVELGEKNIFVFPQERAVSYIEKISDIDILIIDEFYKAGIAFDKERAPILLKAILELGKKAKQKYFLAPNISEIEDNPITDGMEFIPLDFNTVFSAVYEIYKESSDKVPTNDFKATKMLSVLQNKNTKSLIYAGTFNNIDTITNVLKENIQEKNNELLNSFSDWLKTNYHQHYILADIVKKGIGIHNGKLHRSLSQIQVKLFEEENGLDNIVSTSSIIEGVNTSAENVVIWANKNGKAGLNNFTYKNIVGRGGRMFKHFVGKIYLLETPPQQETTQLKLEFTDDLINSLDVEKFRGDLTREQEIKIIAFNDEMDTLLGEGVYNQILKDNSFQTFSPNRLRTIAIDMKNNSTKWNGLVYLNSPNPDDWESNLYLILNAIGAVGGKYSDMVAYIKMISHNWNKTIPQMLPFLQSNGVTVEKFFEMERDVSFKVATMLKDVNLLYNHIFSSKVDISPFIAKISYAFLPKLVYELEEYGLPRMVSKKIQNTGLINLEDSDTPIHNAINQFNQIGVENIKQRISNLHPFELYILDYFYDGIKTK
ncbi:hypothetical protein FACS189420_1420 [Bacteroidia bacterium]|nr:hypothetical protein FACS189420_1420 [Bacteroidia bacterium]